MMGLDNKFDLENKLCQVDPQRLSTLLSFRILMLYHKKMMPHSRWLTVGNPNLLVFPPIRNGDDNLYLKWLL